jgi:hypothetical protein
MIDRSMPADLYQRMEHMRRAGMERDAAKWRLLNGYRQRRSWVARCGCWLLCKIGRQLVLLGRMLQHTGQSHSNTIRP